MGTMYLYFPVVQLLITCKGYVQCHSHASIPASASLVHPQEEEVVSVPVKVIPAI